MQEQKKEETSKNEPPKPPEVKEQPPGKEQPEQKTSPPPPAQAAPSAAPPPIKMEPQTAAQPNPPPIKQEEAKADTRPAVEEKKQEAAKVVPGAAPSDAPKPAGEAKEEKKAAETPEVKKVENVEPAAKTEGKEEGKKEDGAKKEEAKKEEAKKDEGKKDEIKKDEAKKEEAKKEEGKKEEAGKIEEVKKTESKEPAIEVKKEEDKKGEAGKEESKVAQSPRLKKEVEPELIIEPKDERLLWILKHLEHSLTKLRMETMWKREYEDTIMDFLTKKDKRKIFFWLDPQAGLRLDTIEPPKYYDGKADVEEDYNVAFFLKMQDAEIQYKSIEDTVIASSIEGDPLDDLKRKIEQIMPKFRSEKWPEAMKKDFNGQLQAFMASLFEAYQAAKGGAELYIPDEDLSDSVASSKDKDLVQQLESRVIRWTRQIRDVVQLQDSQQERESIRPSEEIEYWRSRKKKLAKIKEQLDINLQLKKIKSVLKITDSPHLSKFEEECKRIEEKTVEAEENVRYLEILTEPFKKLEMATPKEIPNLLPEMLQRIRIIWELSKYYGQQDKMGSLLTKISNEIIRRCKSKIHVDDLLDGDVEKAIEDLDESIECGKRWREEFNKAQQLILLHPKKPGFEFGKSNSKDKNDAIFAQIEAFKQRCTELKDIGQGQLQFAMKGRGIILPEFPGTKGKEITKNLEELKNLFNKQIDTRIREVYSSILDLNNPKWHENITLFKTAMKELDTMLLNIISNAINSVCTVPEAAELVENFDYMAKRESVRDAIYTKIVPTHVYRFFKNELKEVEHIFDHWTGTSLQKNEKKCLLPMAHPNFSGSALFARSLLARIEYANRGMEILFFVRQTNNQEKLDCEGQYRSLRNRLCAYIKSDIYTKWKEKYINKLTHGREEEELKTKLDVPVMREMHTEDHSRREKFALGLECNFDKSLQELYVEVKYWEKVSFSEISIPNPIMKVYKEREAMRVLRENVMLAVRDYNLIVQRLEPDERKLFSQHLASLYNKIMQRIDKFRWSTMQNIKFYQTIRDWRSYCEIVYNLVENYKKNVEIIERQMKMIEDTVMLDIDRSKPYLFKDFVTRQQEAIRKHTVSFQKAAEIIRKCIRDIYYPYFLQTSDEIQLHFHKVLQKYDNMLLEKLKLAVSKTLQELLIALGTDNKEDVCQIIKIESDLIIGDQDIKMFFSPEIGELLEEFEKIFKNIKSAGASIPKIGKKFREDREEMIQQFEKDKKTEEEKKKATGKEERKSILEVGGTEGRYKSFPPLSDTHSTYDEILTQENEVFRKMKSAVEGIRKKMDELKKNFSTHSSQCEKPLVNEEKVIQYHKKFKRGAEYGGHFWERVYNDLEEKGICRAIENLALSTPILVKEQFVEFDSGKLKEKLSDLETKVKALRLKIIYETEAKEMHDLLKLTFPQTIKTLTTTPSTPEELQKIIAAKNNVNLEEINSQIASIQKAFACLNAKDQEVAPGDKGDAENLVNAFKEFEIKFAEAIKTIEKNKKALKENMIRELEIFDKDLELLKADYDRQAPKTIDKYEFANVKKILAEFKEKLAEKEQARDNQKNGRELFGLEETTYFHINYLKKELDLQTKFWDLKEKWDLQVQKMDVVPFRKIEIEKNEEIMATYIEKIEALDNEIKEWQAYNSLFKDMSLTRDTLPLISKISNKAMQQRHWEELYTQLKCEEFNPEGPEFTFAKIKQLHLEKHADFIKNLSEEACRDLELDMELLKIQDRWAVHKLKVKYDEVTGYYKLLSNRDVFDPLEDDLNKLNIMKTSESFQAFHERIDQWESDLIHMSEILDLLLEVQNQWMRQEAIFNGQGWLSKQLGEKTDFDVLHKKYMDQMARIYKQPNVKIALLERNFDKILQELNKRLENIDRDLTKFLDGKRSYYPRFYFLSNDELLEIVGCAHKIEPTKKHLKKIFEGIAEIDSEPGKGQITSYLRSIKSSEGEELPLTEKVEVKRTDGVEDWLKSLQNTVEDSLAKNIYLCGMGGILEKRDTPKTPLDQEVEKFAGQVWLATAHSEWTSQMENILDEKPQVKDRLKALHDEYDTKYIPKLSDKLRSSAPSPLGRLKIQTLMTIEMYLRDVMTDIRAKEIVSKESFEWLKHLRMDKKIQNNEKTILSVKQGYGEISYDYEYQGNNGRLVITPLTERCFFVMSTAIFLKKGGAPQGPAGTGKTETVKDLAKACGKYVVVFNCSESLKVKSLIRMFCGLVTCGAWGCFDEFNRIEIEVLSVAAHHISVILDGIRSAQRLVDLDNASIELDPGCSIFITYNPGYSARTELPDNLKTLFRPIAMMVPDAEAIAESILLSEGFCPPKKERQEKTEKIHKELSRKVISMYNTLQKQLSRQQHYDFGLRAIISVLKYAGKIRREQKADNDLERMREIIFKSLDDLISPKLVGEDTDMFESLLSEMFPGKVPQPDNEDIILAAEELIDQKKMTHNDNQKLKMLQLYNSLQIRHGNMLVGRTMTGKTACWKLLAHSLTYLKEKKDMKFPKVKKYSINPKAVNVEELFGYNKQRGEWQPGVIPTILKLACDESKERGEDRWIIVDGPVDPKWIESLNSLLDDNKCLTIDNGERISLFPNVKMIFEVDTLTNASPSTVSRCGMVFMDIKDIGIAYIESWISKKNEQEKMYLNSFKEKYLLKVLDTKKRCKEPITTSEEASIVNLCKLFDAFAPKSKGKDEMIDDYSKKLERCFIYSLAWSIGGGVDEMSRKEIDQVLRDIDATHCPNLTVSGTIYDFDINLDKGGEWVLWEDKVNQIVKFVQETPYHDLMIETADTVRNRELVRTLVNGRNNVLVVGTIGVGKTALIKSLIQILGREAYHSFNILFSGNTSATKVQEVIESKFESHSKTKLFQPKNRWAICFVDDLNMPKKDEFGSQAPIELLRQWIDYHGWYDKEKIVFKKIESLLLLAAMAPRSGGRAEVPPRMLSKFHLLNYIPPGDKQIIRIFSKIADHKLSTFEDEDIKKMPEDLANYTLNLFRNVSQKFLPTPNRLHYLFSMRDLSKIFQGVQKANKTFYETKETVLYLWVHECMCVFHDRLASIEDRAEFKQLLNLELNRLSLSYEDIVAKCDGEIIFVDFLLEKEVYKDVKKFDDLRKYLEERLKAYNKDSDLNIVLFKDAVYNLCKIYRILKMSRSHALLLGVGGSGRHSLTRLAADVAKMTVETHEMTRRSDFSLFRNTIKGIYKKIGMGSKHGDGTSKQAVFLLSENDILEDKYMEDISNILTSGEVPGLYNSDEMREIRDKISELMRKDIHQMSSMSNMGTVGQQQLAEMQELTYSKFIQNVADNLHVVLCFSPTGLKFRNYSRQYPGILNACTTIYFLGWPEYALTEVAKRFVKETDLPEKQKDGIANTIAFLHSSSLSMADKMMNEIRRKYYLTPTHYMDLMKGFLKIRDDKIKDLEKMKAKLTLGLQKFKETDKKTEAMNVQTSQKKQENQQKVKICAELVAQLKEQEEICKKAEAHILQRAQERDKAKEDAEEALNEANELLAVAEPKLEEAKLALDGLKNSDIAEVRQYQNPQEDIKKVLEAVMVVLALPPTWSVARKEMANPSFVHNIKNFPPQNITDSQLKAMEEYTKLSEFKPANMQKMSSAALAFCKWVLSMEDYAKTLRSLKPKWALKDRALAEIARLDQELVTLEEEKKKLSDTYNEMSMKKKKAEDEKKELQREIDELEVKIERADNLIKNLTDSYHRWEKNLEEMKDKETKLAGDTLLSAAFLSYCGPLTRVYRDELVKMWIAKINEMKITITPSFDFCYFMVGEPVIRQWRMNGLPTDKYSEQNAVIIMKTERWPLIIDPQDQISHWLKATEKTSEGQYRIIQRTSKKFLPLLENSIAEGKVVLIPDIMEELDVELDNLLKKSFIKVGEGKKIKIQKEIKYNPLFKLFMSTKLSNPHYNPEIYTKVTIVNFALTEQALEEQLLDIVFESEERELKKKKDQNAKTIDQNKRVLSQNEDEILQLLNESTATLLDDDTLVNKMRETKELYNRTTQDIENLEANMKKIEQNRSRYKSIAKEGAILYFVLDDMAKLDSMYQFALKAYRHLFKKSIESKSDTLSLGSAEQKLEKMKDSLRSNVYDYACDCLFEKHKLLLAFQIVYRLKMNDIDPELWTFFLKGGVVLNRKEQPQNVNSDWLPTTAWDNITELDKLPAFQGIMSSLMVSSRDWKLWYLMAKPEDATLPSEWDSKCDDALKKMIIIRSLRPDRVTFEVAKLVKKLWPGYRDYKLKPISVRDVMARTKPSHPLLCILGPGVDPVESITALADEMIKGKKILKVSLGQEQNELVTKALEQAVNKDTWVYFANCHYAINSIQDLSERIDAVVSKNMLRDVKPVKGAKEEEKKFRIILSSTSHPKFPVSLLLLCEKITIEPLVGIKSNMCRIYQGISPKYEFKSPADKDKFGKMIFSLAFFHCILQERRRFRNLGWNNVYNFNEADISACTEFLHKALLQQNVQWIAIQETISEALYGGRVTDENDRDILKVFTKEYFGDHVLAKDWRPAKVKDDIVKYEFPPEQPSIKNEEEKKKFNPMEYIEAISSTFASEDPPEVFGQHLNAEIHTQIDDTNMLLNCVLTMQPKVTAAGKGTPEEEVLKLISAILEKDSIPDFIDMDAAKFRLRSENNALNFVLNQECQKYNMLIEIVRNSLTDLMKSLKGEILMTSEMEEIKDRLYSNKVPVSWLGFYPSVKPIGAWIRDFHDRVHFFATWVKSGAPSPFYLYPFTHPLSFSTALLQRYAKKKKAQSLGEVEMQYEFLSERIAVGQPEDGAYVKGLFIEGAKFDELRQLLLDPENMRFAQVMPVIHFKPKTKKGAGKDKDIYGHTYNCPCYYYPIRGAQDSYIFSIPLNCGDSSAEKWLKRGAALLLSLEEQAQRKIKKGKSQLV